MRRHIFFLQLFLAVSPAALTLAMPEMRPPQASVSLTSGTSAEMLLTAVERLEFNDQLLDDLTRRLVDSGLFDVALSGDDADQTVENYRGLVSGTAKLITRGMIVSVNSLLTIVSSRLKISMVCLDKGNAPSEGVYSRWHGFRCVGKWKEPA